MRKSLKLGLCLGSLLLLVSAQVKADYLDVTYNNSLNIEAKFMTRKVIMSVEVDDEVSNVGFGYGFRQREFQLFTGLTYDTNEDARAFIHGFYKQNRHVYELETTMMKGEGLFRVGYNQLLDESFGFYGNVDSKGKIEVGLRKWF